MGNCGIGFAPVRPDRHYWLVDLMEGVEDIPGSALSEGITWEWEAFGEYLDALERMPRAVDVGDSVISGATISGLIPAVPGAIGILQYSSGGLKLSDSKIIGVEQAPVEK